MKICIGCGYRFESQTWQCAKCGYEPEMHDEFPFFAPHLIDTYSGFEARFFHDLAKVENGNFWFESRNRLLIWALKRNFPEVSNFLEIGCGRVLYFLIYIIAGACSAWFFCLFNLHSTLPLMGASGSISGLMGAYTVLYGKSN